MSMEMGAENQSYMKLVTCFTSSPGYRMKSSTSVTRKKCMPLLPGLMPQNGKI